MIYTITFAPSLDYVINSKNDFNQNGLNRINDYSMVPGGKGINASIILKRLGIDNTAILFLGGDIGKKIENLIANEKVDVKTIQIENETRINVKYLSQNAEFEINGPRPNLNEKEKQDYLNFLKNINSNDFVFVMGLGDFDLLKSTLQYFNENNIKFALDVDTDKINELLEYKPSIVKPNIHETKNIVGYVPKNVDEIKSVLIELKNKQIDLPIISDGKNGSYYLDNDNKLIRVRLLKPIEAVSAVGAGDTLISSLYGFKLLGNNFVETVKKATAMSVGTVTTKWLANADDVSKHYNNVLVEYI